MRETVDEKAVRLLSSGKVRVLHSGCDRVVARVEGDHGVYAVVGGGGIPLRCECKAAERFMRCSHLIAVERITA
jgi:uncharacterized Zn finger protein